MQKSLNKSLLATIWALIVCSSHSISQQKNTDPKLGKETITVYVSSIAGERLSRKRDNHFNESHNYNNPIIQVDDDTVYQVIDGIGATFNEAGLLCINSLPKEAQKKVFIALFDTVKGAGFTLMKSPIAACDFASAGSWYSYDEIPDDTLMEHFTIQRDLGPSGLVTFIKKASEYGKFKIESPMDFAPDWMYYSLRKGEKHIKPQYYKSLALYYSRYLKSYQLNGVHIDFLNLFNEAHNDWYSNVTYLEMGDLIKNFVAPQLKADGSDVKIQLGETSNRPEALQKFPEVLKDPDVVKNIHSLTVHGYDWNKFSSLTKLHDLFPHLPIYQTEVCYAMPNNVPPNGPKKLPVYEFADGEFWGNMIANDFKNWASGWIYWNMILDENGGPWLVSEVHGDPDHNNQHPVVIINRKTKKIYFTGLYYYLSHFSRFVRPGAYRIKTSSDLSQLNITGFKNADHSIILNIINNGEMTNSTILYHNRSVVQSLPSHSITTLKWLE